MPNFGTLAMILVVRHEIAGRQSIKDVITLYQASLILQRRMRHYHYNIPVLPDVETLNLKPSWN